MVSHNNFICKNQQRIFIHKLISFLLYVVLINSIVINVGNAIPFSRVHDNVQNITEGNFFNDCKNCHSKDRINPEGATDGPRR